MPVWLMALLTGIIGLILKRVSEPIKDAIDKFLDDLEKRAKQTPNTMDDVLVDFLRELLQRND